MPPRDAILPERPPELSLALPCELASCDVARQALQRLIAPHEPSARAGFGLEVVLEELLMNQLLHAHPGGHASASVQLLAWVAGDTLLLQLADNGIPFDPLAQPAPVAPANLDDARPGGLGLHLLRRYVNTLAYERSNGENRLTVGLALR
ncbi:ATP-binding protein [Roseateles cellulosilyticus]|uniref:ATP-binding protein n=1 Tax=Pelomonas cellulosilytica TaxID=2906762 RepID=A0ABS8Y2T6_9BURK|nr:ATP-binding protein [Pelomonas sp. P8]MCE4557431.1 ATP-binding protein [Pelomonas sp. P8]